MFRRQKGHSKYPVTCGEESPKEVMAKNPLYLKEFIMHRLEGRLDPLVEKETKAKVELAWE